MPYTYGRAPDTTKMDSSIPPSARASPIVKSPPSLPDSFSAPAPAQALAPSHMPASSASLNASKRRRSNRTKLYSLCWGSKHSPSWFRRVLSKLRRSGPWAILVAIIGLILAYIAIQFAVCGCKEDFREYCQDEMVCQGANNIWICSGLIYLPSGCE